MENIVLVVHMIIALALIGIVLMQRSEGGGLGMGSGGAMSGRSAATALTKMTWILAAGFFATSLTLTIMASQNSRNSSVIDLPASDSAELPAVTLPALEGDLTPGALTEGPATPPAAAPATDTAPTT